MRYKILLSVFVLAFLLATVSAAVTCNPVSLSESYSQGTSGVSITTLCTNSGNSSVTVSKTGSYFTLDQTILPATSSNTIRATFDASAPAGNNQGSITFGDGSTPIPILFVVSSNTPTSSCSINIFPTTLTNIKVQQGEKKTRTVTLTVPSCFTSTISVQGVSLQTDEKPIQLGELSVGNLQPGQSLNVPLDIDATGVSTGQYSDVLQLLLYNSTGHSISVPNTNIGVLVSQGISPLTNFSITQLPACSLSAGELSLNQTYSFSCSINNPNIKVQPIIDPAYFIGVSDTSTTTQYVYNFKPKKIGNTYFSANFIYEGSSGKSLIGEPFNQTLKISNTGGVSSGSSLDLTFYQDGVKKSRAELQSKETIIQVVDNSSKNLLNDAQILVGGVLLQNKTLFLNQNQTFFLRVQSAGYNDLETNLSSSESGTITITISPSREIYYIGDSVEITADQNASISINDVLITSPSYIFTTVGTFSLKAKKTGYADAIKNLTVANPIKANIISPEPADWKKGEEIKMTLSEPGLWNVTVTTTKEDGTTETRAINSGVGADVRFKLLELGRYDVLMNGRIVESYLLVKKGWQSWQIGGLSIIGLGVLIWGFSRMKSKSSDDDLSDITGVG